MAKQGRTRIVILDRGRAVTIQSSRCRQRKTLDEFGLRTTKDGTQRNQPQCRDCRSRRPASSSHGLITGTRVAVPFKLILASIARRRRNRAETQLRRLAAEARVPYGDAVRFGRYVESVGLGRLVVGRRGSPSRIRWTIALKDITGRLAPGGMP